ncbi:hypothetical protein PCE1_004682 [Barthelona sp. PCE]
MEAALQFLKGDLESHYDKEKGTNVTKTVDNSIIAYTARYPQKYAPDKIMQAHRDIVREFNSEKIHIRGILIVLPKVCVHVLEGDYADILRIATRFHMDEVEMNIVDTNVFLTCSDCPIRFRGWDSIVINSIPAEVDMVEEEQAITSARRLRKILLALGDHVVTLPESEVTAFLLRVKDTNPTLIPSDENIRVVMESASAFPNLLEWEEIFRQAYETELVTDKMVPVLQPMKIPLVMPEIPVVEE